PYANPTRRLPPGVPTFPYTTLFRSEPEQRIGEPAGARVPEPEAHRPFEIAGAGALRRHPGVGRQHLAEIQEVLHRRSPFISSCADRKSTRLNSSHVSISYAVFCLKK